MPNLVGIGLSQVPTNGMLGGMAYQDPEHASIKNLDLKNLSQINSETADTAYDIFVYDTRKDSDGGAWRKRTQHTTWYNETLGTATRGTRREFPAVAVIVSESNRVVIYDGDDPDLPMWMTFEPNGIIDWPTSTLSRIKLSAMNGIMVTVTNDGGGIFKFVEDFVDIIYNNNNYPITSDRSIGGRNNVTGYVGLSDRAPRVFEISNYSTRDVAMTVLPNAPIDERTGLPTPSIAVANDASLNVIHNDGSVRKLSDSLGATRKFETVITLGSDVIGFNQPNGTIQRFFNALNLRGDNNDFDMKYNYTFGGGGGSTENISAVLRETTNVPIGLVSEDPHNRFTAFDADGVSRFIDGTDRSFTASSFTIFDSSVAYITSNYNTGYMHGDIRGAYLSDTSTTTKTNGQTELDRSVFGNNLTVSGSITKSVVAPGADLVCYSGFSASNQLNSTTAQNFGNPVKFSITTWFNVSTAGNYQYLTSLYDSTSGKVCGLAMYVTDGRIYTFDTNAALTADTNNLADGLWHQVVGVFDKTSRRIYVDGEEVGVFNASTAPSMSATSRLSIGHYNYQNNYNYPWLGKLALMRYSKTIPSKERIKQIYEEERHLFTENAKSTLYGSSDAVTAAAFDDTTNILHVGTSAGRSEISGLRRINNTTTAVTTAISASNELVAEQ